MDLLKEFGREIRTTQYNGEKYYSIIDLCAIAADTKRAKTYWTDLKSRKSKGTQNAYPSLIPDAYEAKEESMEAHVKILPLLANDGKYRRSDCATREGCFRILQEIDSPRTDKIKNWLAHLGEERAKEHETPGLATDRALKHDKRMYEEAGFPKDWANKRLASKASRKEFTDQIAKNKGKDYSGHTNTLHRGAFGVDTKGHKEAKGLKKSGNLRDNMSMSELAMSSLSEAWAAEDIKVAQPTGDGEINNVVQKTAESVSVIRNERERTTGRPIINYTNNKDLLKKEGKLLRKRKKLTKEIK